MCFERFKMHYMPKKDTQRGVTAKFVYERFSSEFNQYINSA